MQYYLDTNIIYNLKNLPESALKVSYASFLSMLEIVAGINERNYSKRKAALKATIDSKLQIDWRTPDMIIFDCFNSYREFSMSDSTVEALVNTVLKCVWTESYADFSAIKVNGTPVIDYFKKIDTGITQKFNNTFPDLIQSIKKSALVQTITNGDISVEVDFTEAVKSDFINDSKHAMLVKNLAVSCQYIIEHSNADDKPDFQLPDVINSYNGGADFFICAWLSYQLKNIGVGNLPGRNDFQDLLHFLYLRNHLNKKNC